MSETFELDWETLVGGALAFFKFLLSLYGVPDSTSQAPPSLSVHETVLIVRVEDPHTIDETRKVLEKRLRALLLPSDSIEMLEGHLQVRTRLPDTNDGLAERILATGKVTATHADETLLEASDFKSAEVWPAGSRDWRQTGVKLVLTDLGREKWSEATARLIGQRVILLLDGKILMSPTVMEGNRSGEIVISGPDIPTDELLFYINAGHFSAGVELLETRQDLNIDKEL